MKTAVIFGGSGFIGSHFAQYLLDNGLVQKVVVVDIVPLDKNRVTESYASYVSQGQISFVEGDVRQPINLNFEGNITLIANFAAVHREPGHEPHEYYETNLLGAENVCNWASTINCENIIFTSSIAPYGPSEEARDEQSLPVPATAYGGSKLAAEKIHQTWQAADTNKRKLVVVRPGVVFGAGEGGNVTRLIKATVKRYFFYMGNKNTRKAGTYVKELCNAMWWALSKKAGQTPVLFNMSMNPGPTIEEYVNTVCDVAEIKRFVPNVPFSLMYTASLVIDPITKLAGIEQPISPVRMRKLVKSNNIIPQYLADNSYQYLYTFKQALSDWRQDNRKDWGE
ncbi:MAG: NAD(P)-dependent oxidoreductase [Cycloclasticus sp.]